MSKQTESDKKQFGLKANEATLIQGELNCHNQALASLLSFIAVERLAYPVDKDTAFTLSQDMTELLIWQNIEEADVKPVDLAGGASDTAKTMETK